MRDQLAVRRCCGRRLVRLCRRAGPGFSVRRARIAGAGPVGRRPLQVLSRYRTPSSRRSCAARARAFGVGVLDRRVVRLRVPLSLRGVLPFAWAYLCLCVSPTLRGRSGVAYLITMARFGVGLRSLRGMGILRRPSAAFRFCLVHAGVGFAVGSMAGFSGDKLLDETLSTSMFESCVEIGGLDGCGIRYLGGRCIGFGRRPCLYIPDRHGLWRGSCGSCGIWARNSL